MFDGVNIKSAQGWIHQESGAVCDFVARESQCASAWLKEHSNVTNWAVAGLTIVGLTKCGLIGQELEAVESKVGTRSFGESCATFGQEGSGFSAELTALENQSKNGLMAVAKKTGRAVRGVFHTTLRSEDPSVVKNLIGKYQDLDLARAMTLPAREPSVMAKYLTRDHASIIGSVHDQAQHTMSWWNDEKQMQSLTKKIQFGHAGS
jgi:hypothetical protein